MTLRCARFVVLLAGLCEILYFAWFLILRGCCAFVGCEKGDEKDDEGELCSVICNLYCPVPFPSLFFVFLERCRDAYPFFLSEEDKEDVGLVFVPLNHLCSRVS